MREGKRSVLRGVTFQCVLELYRTEMRYTMGEWERSGGRGGGRNSRFSRYVISGRSLSDFRKIYCISEPEIVNYGTS